MIIPVTKKVNTNSYKTGVNEMGYLVCDFFSQ